MIGRTISHFEILEKLGQGGMGVVYRARDTQLGRFVALKVLPEEALTNADRKRRFIQEARSASALNHPNIITIYEIAQAEGVDFIAMEYVAGQTLDRLIGRRGLRLPEVLKHAGQLASALTAAHAAGIVHRDLKPANVMVNEQGLVKVLDFGLAKLTEREADGGDHAPTVDEAPQTEEGTLVGTVAYMSPEQVEGRKLDARSDIFSFGVVLYEMVTGQRAFQRESRIATLTAILRDEPKPASEAAGAIPPELERIIARCLRKDLERRYQHIDDVKIALEDVREESESGAGRTLALPPRRRWAPAAVVVGAVVVAGGLGLWWFSRGSPPPPAAPLIAVPFTTYPGVESGPTFSPDGSQVAFVWSGEKPPDTAGIYVKRIGPGPPLRITTGPGFGPAWSPDGQFIAFLRPLANRKLGVFLIPPLGGPERQVGEIRPDPGAASLTPGNLTWLADCKGLVVAEVANPSEPQALLVLSVETGEKKRLTTPPPLLRGDASPALSPDGRRLAFNRFAARGVGQLYVLDLSADLRPQGEPVRLHPESSSRPAWTPDGREIVFASRGGLWRIAASGAGKPQALGAVGQDGSQPAIARAGPPRLVYVRQSTDQNIWRLDLSRPGAQAAPFSASTQREWTPQFSPDGKRVAFESNRSGSAEIWVSESDGSSPVQITSMGGPMGAGTPRWSPDGRRIVFDSRKDGQAEIYTINAQGGAPQRVTNHPANDTVPSWSRDGKWIYFASNRSGQAQVWKAPVDGGEPIQVTRNGGHAALESPDGKWIFYDKDYSSLWKVPVQGGEETQVAESLAGWASFAVTVDGIYWNPGGGQGSGSSVQFLRFAGGKMETVASLDRGGNTLAVSPDNRWLLYTRMDQLGSDLMLVEGFR